MPDYVPTPRSILPHALSLACRRCSHMAAVDLPGLIAQGRGEVPIRDLPFRCGECGGRGFDLIVSGGHLAGGKG